MNDIIGNSDFANVLVEDSIINDNSLVTTYINGLVACKEPRTPCGVYVEQVNYFDGNVEVPVNLEVFLNTTIEGKFYPNGGIVSDANVHGSILPGVTSFPNGGYSFIVEDNTGNTGMTGELRLYGGLDADSGVFTVAEGTGETRIATALFKPNGGINVQDGQFTVAKEDGTFFTTSFANVVGDFYLGTSKSEDRYITRYAASSSFGGDTYLLGQSVSASVVEGGATNTGGNIILEPGVGQDRQIGKIILGRQADDNLYFGRPPVDVSGTSGGDTTIEGQTTAFGDGGDIVLSSGDSTSSGNGGNIILDVGYSETGVHGEIIIGNQDSPFYEIYLERPFVSNSPGGATYLTGQTTNAGNAGDLYLRAGGIVQLTANPVQFPLTNLAGTPGDIVLSGGDNTLSSDNSQGDIILGRSTPVDLIVKRYPVLADNANGGDTYIHAVDNLSANNNGGDLFLEAGDAGNGGNGGDVRLKIGDNLSTSINYIYWGTETFGENHELIVERAVSRGAGGSTNILGQESVTSNGGNLRLKAAYGETTSGDIEVSAGAGDIDDGGSITFTGGDGNQNGGLVTFTAGSSTTGTPGNIALETGSTSSLGNGRPGNFYLNAGSGSTLGDIQILNARELALDITSVTLYDYLQLVTASNDNIIFEANSESILSYNGVTLLKDRIFNVQQVPNVNLVYNTGAPEPLDFPLNVVQQIQFLQDTTQNLVNVLSQCGHGLFNVPEGNNFACILPGSVPTPISRPV